MKIIKQGKRPEPEYNLKCHKCDCEAIYTDTDIQRDHLGQYVKCPCCDSIIEHEPHKVGGYLTLREINALSYTELCKKSEAACEGFNKAPISYKHSEAGTDALAYIKALNAEIERRNAIMKVN